MRWLRTLLVLMALVCACAAQTITYAPWLNPHQQFFNNNGNPLAGGRLTTYAAGTLNPLTTYQDRNGTVPNTNPIILDSAGYATIYMNTAQLYKVVGQDASGVQLWVVDNVSGAGGGGGGGGGGGAAFRVPTDYPTVQGAINAAVAAGSGPVMVLPNATDTTPVSNPNNVRVIDYRQKGGIDSPFFRDASEWGVKADGAIVSCTTTVGSSLINCPGANFTSGDVGKLFLAYGGGPQTSGHVQMHNTVTVSGGTGGAPNTYYLWINTDATSGCNTLDTQPYGWVLTNASGVPTTVGWLYNMPGIGCTHFPTTATATGITGTMTFSGGYIMPLDQPTTITAVVSPTQISVADNMGYAQSAYPMMYGTDDQAAWQIACNAMKDISGAASSRYSHGTLTFHGTSMVSAGVSCNGPNLWIEGAGQLVLGDSAASILVYAGKNTGDYVLRLDGGQAMRLTRMGLRGNSLAMPNLLVLSKGRNNATGTGTTGYFEDLSFGWMFGDVAGQPYNASQYQETSCIFFNAANQGNVDFNHFDRIYCRGSLVGWNGDNNQATEEHIGTWHGENNIIGLAIESGTVIDDYYTEYNKLDMMFGSPDQPGWFPGVTLINHYAGESSAEAMAMSTLVGQDNAAQITINDAWSLGFDGYIGPKNLAIDMSNMLVGYFTYTGRIPGPMTVQYGCQNSADYNIATPQSFSLVTFVNGGYSSNCKNIVQSAFKWTWNGQGSGSNAAQVVINSFNALPSSSLTTEVPGSATIYGSGQVVPVTPQGDDSLADGTNNFLEAFAGAGTGSTVYTYWVACLDPLGFESTENPHALTVTNAATLDANHWNGIGGKMHKGCLKYRLYGNEGSGGIGLLSTQDQTTIYPQLQGSTGSFIGAYFADSGQFTKNTAITPKTFPTSGNWDTHSLTIAGKPFATAKPSTAPLTGTKLLSDFSIQVPLDGQAPVWSNASQLYIPGFAGPTTYGTTGGVAGVLPSGLPISGGDSSTYSSTVSPGELGGTYRLEPFIPSLNATISDCKPYVVAAGTNIRCALYDSDGTSVQGDTDAPGTYLCSNWIGITPTANSYNIIPMATSGCPELALGHKYYAMLWSDSTTTIKANTGISSPPYTFFSQTGNTGLYNPLSSGSPVNRDAAYSFIVDMATVVGWTTTPGLLTASLNTTAATSDNVTLTGMVSTGHCAEPAATNSSANANKGTTYISAKAANQITVTHTATAGMTYDIMCTIY